MPVRRMNNRGGFTLIELMIVMSIIGILAAISVPNYQWGVIRAKESVLRENLYTIRSGIDQFFADQGRYPESLADLVEKKYLRDIPQDPFTNSKDTWITSAPPLGLAGISATGGPSASVYDVYSGSNLIASSGTPYNEW